MQQKVRSAVLFQKPFNAFGQWSAHAPIIYTWTHQCGPVLSPMRGKSEKAPAKHLRSHYKLHAPTVAAQPTMNVAYVAVDSRKTQKQVDHVQTSFRRSQMQTASYTDQGHLDRLLLATGNSIYVIVQTNMHLRILGLYDAKSHSNYSYLFITSVNTCIQSHRQNELK